MFSSILCARETKSIYKIEWICTSYRKCYREFSFSHAVCLTNSATEV